MSAGLVVALILGGFVVAYFIGLWTGLVVGRAEGQIIERARRTRRAK